MCDDYDDERMRAFWRALAEREDVAKLVPGAETTDAEEHPIRELGEAVEPKRAKPRPLVH